MADDENPDYITVVHLGASNYNINRMSWDARADGYMVIECRKVSAGAKDYADSAAQRWANEENLEVR